VGQPQVDLRGDLRTSRGALGAAASTCRAFFLPNGLGSGGEAPASPASSALQPAAGSAARGGSPLRGAIFDYYRTLGWLITSECATDWAVPLSDSMPIKMPIVNHGAHAQQVPGTPLPLFSLAFHDSVLLNNWGVPPLEAALWGVNAYYPEHPGLFAAIKQTAFMPLTSHELLSADGAEQESVFGGSVRVRANLKNGAYEVSGVKGGVQKGVVKENVARRN